VKFTGQVRVPEVDHPGVPATIVVEEGQTEVFLEGESLGRWSLFDVRAARLVSSAFSLSLDGEEITFIADEPVDFAYKGVDHMAGVWARYKSMTIPRRVVAVGRSRRGTLPSRIPELRDAMLLNLQTASRGAPRQASMEAITTTLPAEPSPWTKRIDAYSNVPKPIDTDLTDMEPVDVEPIDTDLTDMEPIDTEPVAVEPTAELEDETSASETAAAIEMEPETDLVDAVEASVFAAEIEPSSEPVMIEEAQVETSRLPLRPGPGLIPRRVERPEAEQVGEPFWDDAWEEPPNDEGLFEDDLPPDADLIFAVEDLPADIAEGGETAEVEADEVVALESEPVVAVENEPVFAEETPAALAQDLPISADETEVGGPDVPESTEEWMVVAAAEATIRPEVVLDLDHLHTHEPSSIEPDLELLFAGAPAPEGEKGGLLGAVRSAFARNKTSHEHEFVEAPGGIGIVRQICADCGYISIGVSD
jgi:hypothetical protein